MRFTLAFGLCGLALAAMAVRPARQAAATTILCELGLALDAEEALSLIRSARPLARPSGEQRAALARFLASDRTHPAG